MKTLHDPEWCKEARVFLQTHETEAIDYLFTRKGGRFFERNISMTRDYYNSNKSLKQVADVYGISPERTRQILMKQLRILSWYVKHGGNND